MLVDNEFDTVTPLKAVTFRKLCSGVRPLCLSFARETGVLFTGALCLLIPDKLREKISADPLTDQERSEDCVVPLVHQILATPLTDELKSVPVEYHTVGDGSVRVRGRDVRKRRHNPVYKFPGVGTFDACLMLSMEKFCGFKREALHWRAGTDGRLLFLCRQLPGEPVVPVGALCGLK